jgi:hypothetical protein
VAAQAAATQGLYARRTQKHDVSKKGDWISDKQPPETPANRVAAQATATQIDIVCTNGAQNFNIGILSGSSFAGSTFSI